MGPILISLACTILGGLAPAVVAWVTSAYEPPLAELLARGRLMDSMLQRFADDTRDTKLYRRATP